MNRIIVHYQHKDYRNIVGTSQTEDHVFNNDLKCIEIDNEYFCFINLKYKLNVVSHLYSDMPTYAIISTPDLDHIV